MNDLLIDQTWVHTWRDRPSRTEDPIHHNCKWLRKLDPELRVLAIEFPPNCLVTGDEDLAVPFMGTKAIVITYSPGHLGLRQAPGEGAIHYVPASKLRYFSPWGPFTPDFMRGLWAASKRKDEAYHLRPEHLRGGRDAR